MSATGCSKIDVGGIWGSPSSTQDWGEKDPQRSKIAETPVSSPPSSSPIFFLFFFPVILYHFILDFASKTLTSRIKWRSSYISSRIIATHPPTTLVAQIHPASS